MSPESLISVIMPAYNEEGYIGAALRSIQSQSLDRDLYEVVVVDGGSKDGTHWVASKYADRVVRQSGSGIGQARNQGAMASRGSVLVHTDADVLAPHKWLENMYGLVRGDGVVAACGPCYPSERSLRHGLEFAFGNASQLLHRFGIVVTRGTNTAVLRSAFEMAGGYSDISVLDDVELGYRLKRLGRIVCSRRAAVYASARRFRKNGFLATNLSWAKGNVMAMTGWRWDERYARQEY